jgi:hypothetical protein
MTSATSAEALDRATPALVEGGWLTGNEAWGTENAWLAFSVAEVEAEHLDREFDRLEELLRAVDADGRFRVDSDLSLAKAAAYLGWMAEAPEEPDYVTAECSLCTSPIYGVEGAEGVFLGDGIWRCWYCVDPSEIEWLATEWERAIEVRTASVDAAAEEVARLRLRLDQARQRNADLGRGADQYTNRTNEEEP